VDGRSYPGAVEALGDHAFVWRRGTRAQVFHCVREGDVIHLSWGGRTYRCVVEPEGRRAAERHASGALEAPMPGKVIAVHVRAGQDVKKGDELLVVEAMKMENAVRAPREGRVKAVAVKPGDTVSPGLVLVELE